FKWYAYSFGFSNPEAPSDSWVFAPVYVSAWPVMETGLFAINRYTGATPERIADIDAATSGNRLLMRCNIADLTGDRRFGPWPNTQGWLHAAATTQTITTSGATTNDTTVAGQFHPLQTGRPALGSNRPLSLTLPRVSPDTGTPETEFSFSVSYTDPDTNPPTLCLVQVGADSFRLAPDNRRYWRGATFRARRAGFPPGRHEAVFRFSDGAAQAEARAVFFVADTVGIAEDPGRREGRERPAGASIRRGVLRLPASLITHPSSLIASDGRKVMDLVPGDNDVSRLAPGVYFILAGPAGRDRQRLVVAR
ncbi:MAG: hypothetical protein R6X14_06680, partial [bacterium]